MGMSTYVKGFRPPDEDYRRKAEAWRACKAAGVKPPPELLAMFDGAEPDEAGQEVSLGDAVREHHPRDMQDAWDVEIAKLPPGVKVVRFYNSY